MSGAAHRAAICVVLDAEHRCRLNTRKTGHVLRAQPGSGDLPAFAQGLQLVGADFRWPRNSFTAWRAGHIYPAGRE